MTVVVTVLTYRRNHLLERILPMLGAQAASLDPPGSVLVIDNSPEGDAADTVAAFGAARYVHEPHPGIAAARNRAIDSVGRDDVIVFIDDDEEPLDDWLPTLVKYYIDTGADAVVGRVDPEFDAPLEPWLLAGGFFVQPQHPTGTRVIAAATNNLLLPVRTLTSYGLRFDEQFGISGGSDTLLTRQLLKRGGSLIWCNEARVRELVPVSRAGRAWAVRRWFRSGNTWGRVSVYIEGSALGRTRARVLIFRLGIGRLLGGALQALWGTIGPGGVDAQAQGVRRGARGLGMLSAACGYVYMEYRRRDS